MRPGMSALNPPPIVRPCFVQDLQSVRLLLNHHALTGYTWLEEAEQSLEEMQELWTWVVGQNLPFLVAAPLADLSRILGVGYALPGLFAAAALRGGPELRVAVAPSMQGRGVGRLLLHSLIEELRAPSPRTVFAAYGVTNPSPPFGLLQHFGFSAPLRLEQAARKFERTFDVALAFKHLPGATGRE